MPALLQVALHLGQTVTRLERSARQVCLADGSAHPYDALVLATGSRPRSLPLPGIDLGGVHVLRSIADADALRTDALRGVDRPTGRAVILGGGYIGLEVAATLRQLGLEVTVLEVAERVMNRVVAEPVSRWYEAEHARRGVDIRLGARPLALEGDAKGRVRAVVTAAGTLAADMVVLGVGVLPNDGLARDADLPCENGIRVDERCRTADPAIHAIGDCTNHPSVHYGGRVRLESVDNAVEQANTAAADLLGIEARHERVPWFWSDQYDVKLQMVGLSQDHDAALVRGEPASGAFSVFYFKTGALVGVDSINRPAEHMLARKLMQTGAVVPPKAAADPAFDLKTCLPPA